MCRRKSRNGEIYRKKQEAKRKKYNAKINTQRVLLVFITKKKQKKSSFLAQKE